MRVDIDTSIGTFENIQRFSIAQGEKFVLAIIEDPQTGMTPRWASFNDPVLDIRDEDLVAQVTATKTGDAEIWIVDGDSILKKLFITVLAPKKEAVSSKTKISEEPLK
jgi:predicted secreted protein